MNFRDQVDFDTRPEWYLGHSKGAAGMLALVSEHFGKQFRGAVSDKMLLRECRRAIHQDHQLEDSFDLIEIADSQV